MRVLRIILAILKWFAKFAGHITTYHLIARVVFDYKILFLKMKYREDIESRIELLEDEENRKRRMKKIRDIKSRIRFLENEEDRKIRMKKIKEYLY